MGNKLNGRRLGYDLAQISGERAQLLENNEGWSTLLIPALQKDLDLAQESLNTIGVSHDSSNYLRGKIEVLTMVINFTEDKKSKAVFNMKKACGINDITSEPA